LGSGGGLLGRSAAGEGEGTQDEDGCDKSHGGSPLSIENHQGKGQRSKAQVKR
jgi:hypothetical protein